MVARRAQRQGDLLEFGDLQCPVCKGFSEEILPQVIENQVGSGEAKLDFRNFTIIGAASTPAGAAAIAAGEQGRGWNFVELFYRNQGAEDSGYADRRIPDRDRQGRRRPGHRQVERRPQEQRVHRTKSTRPPPEAERLGFTGTPSFAVKGPSTNGLELLGTPARPRKSKKRSNNAS